MSMAAIKNPRINKADTILAAARYLFLKNGYVETTMDAVAAKAGMTKQTIYSYYENKEALFTQIITEFCNRKPTAKGAPLPENAPFSDLLEAVGLSVLDLITTEEVLATTRLVIAEADRYPKLAKMYYESGTQRLVQMLAEFLDKQNRAGKTRIPNTQSAASYFLAMLKGQYYLRMILKIKPSPSESLKTAHVKDTVRVFMQLYVNGTPLKTESIL